MQLCSQELYPNMMPCSALQIAYFCAALHFQLSALQEARRSFASSSVLATPGDSWKQSTLLSSRTQGARGRARAPLWNGLISRMGTLTRDADERGSRVMKLSSSETTLRNDVRIWQEKIQRKKVHPSVYSLKLPWLEGGICSGSFHVKGKEGIGSEEYTGPRRTCHAPGQGPQLAFSPD